MSTSIECKYLEVLETNKILKKENDDLKKQMKQTINFSQELKSLHTEKRDLNNKILESSNKVESLQEHLKLYKEKNKVLNENVKLLEASKNLALSQAESLRQENECIRNKVIESQEKLEQLRTCNSRLKNTEISFFQKIGELYNSNIQTFDDIIEFFKKESRSRSDDKKGGMDKMHILYNKNLKLKKIVKEMKHQNEQKELKIKELEKKLKEDIRIQSEIESNQLNIVSNNSSLSGKCEQLRKEINEAHELYDKLKKESEAERSNFKIQLEQKDKTIDDIISRTKLNINQINELKQTNKILKNKLTTIKKKLESNLYRSYIKIKQSKQKVEKLSSIFREKDNNKEIQIQKLEKLNKDYQNQIKSLLEENEKIKQKMINEIESIQSEKSKLEMKIKEFQNALTTVELQMNSQLKDITELSKSKNSMYSIIEKMNSLMLSFDSSLKIETEKHNYFKNEYYNLKSKLKSNIILPESYLNYLSNQYIQQFGKNNVDKLSSFMNDNSLLPSEKIQNLFNEIYLLYNKENSKNNEDNQFLTSLVSSLHGLLSRKYGNKELIDLISNKIHEIESSLKTYKIKMNALISFLMEQLKRELQLFEVFQQVGLAIKPYSICFAFKLF